MSITPYTFDLEPGQTKHQTFGEANYIFVDFADRTIEVSINNEWQSLRKGSRYRSKTGLFDHFSIRNPDKKNPARVIMFIGTDEVDNQIVEGELSIVPILRNADGTTKTDTRFTLDIDLLPVSANVTTLAVGDVLYTAALDNPPDAWLSGGGVFRAPDGTIGQTLLTQFGGKYGLALFDADGNAIQYGEVHKEAKLDKSLVYTAATGWAVASGASVRGPLVIGSTSDLSTFFTWDKAIESMTVNGDGNLVLIDKALNVAVVSTATFEIIQTATIEGPPTDPSWAQNIAYDDFNGRYYLQSYTSANNYILNEAFQVIETLAGFTGQPSPTEGRHVFRNTIYVSRTQQVAQLYSAKVWRPYDTSPKVQAVRPGCGLNNTLLKRTDPILLTADITATETANGIKLQGELIKAALEYYFRAAVPADYLDHVYGFDVSRDQNGYPFKKLVSGNETFAAANIADNLSTLTPARVTLILDNELKLGANL